MNRQRVSPPALRASALIAAASCATLILSGCKEQNKYAPPPPAKVTAGMSGSVIRPVALVFGLAKFLSHTVTEPGEPSTKGATVDPMGDPPDTGKAMLATGMEGGMETSYARMEQVLRAD